jgi:hypothetical protein
VTLACFVGFGLIYIAGALRLASGASLRPTRDPRLPEALAFSQ